MFYCYKITKQVNNKLYIGITKNFEQRRRQHVNVSTSTTDPQYNHSKPTAVPYRVLNNQKYNNLFKNSKKTNLSNGIEKTVKWFNSKEFRE